MLKSRDGTFTNSLHVLFTKISALKTISTGADEAWRLRLLSEPARCARVDLEGGVVEEREMAERDRDTVEGDQGHGVRICEGGASEPFRPA